MNIDQMLSDLRAELAALDHAIAAIGRLAQSGHKRRGRPPAWLNSAVPKMEDQPRRKRGRPRKS